LLLILFNGIAVLPVQALMRSSFFQLLFHRGRATQRPRPLASRTLATVVVAATTFVFENGAPTFVNFSIRPLSFDERGSLHRYPPFELQKLQQLQKVLIVV
jgi:hypothetical protein